MPYRTRYGSHYHMTEGCHGATIPCDTKGLTPCSDCCGKGTDGVEAHAGGNPIGPGTGNGGRGRGDSECRQEPSVSERESATSQPVESTLGKDVLLRGMEVADAGIASASGASAPDISIDATEAERQDEPGRLVIEGGDYPGKGQGWPLRQRGRDYSAPAGGGYAYLTRRQAGIVYAAAKRGDVSLDKRHAREMYGIVEQSWMDLDLHGRSIMLHVDAAIDHIIAGRMELAQAELDGRFTEERRRVVGTRKVVVTDDNWIDFAFDLDHDYEVGDLADEDIIETYWHISDHADRY